YCLPSVPCLKANSFDYNGSLSTVAVDITHYRNYRAFLHAYDLSYTAGFFLADSVCGIMLIIKQVR
ncbi:TPA: hypothetical protein ACGOR6_002085, partial [Streptococcus suis]